jgi:methionyl-tRNA synthetase
MDPFMPFTTQKLRGILGVGGISASGITKKPEVLSGTEGINVAPATCCCCSSPIVDTFVLSWDRLGRSDLIEVGHKLGEATLLFEKIEDSTIESQLKKLENTKKSNLMANAQATPQKENISFDDFGKMDIRIVKILEAEKVAKTKKLMKMLVDTGIDQRTVISGVAEYFEPENLIGKQVCMLINLAPREIKGIASEGMILYAEDADGSLRLVQPAVAVNNGSEVK